MIIMQKAALVCPQCKNCIIDDNPFDNYIFSTCEAYDCLTCPQCVIDAKPKEPKKIVMCQEYKWNLDRLIAVDAMVPCNHPEK